MTQTARKIAVPVLSVVADRAAAEVRLARLVADQIRHDPASVLGLATGNSMIGVYGALVAIAESERLSFAGVTSFNLDEYCGLPDEHPARFSAYMHRHLFDLVDLRPERTHLPQEGRCTRYEAAIAEAGLDLQILGIGRNGHIGFNEPGAEPTSRTRVVDLDETTRTANRRDFPAGEEVPGRAVTMGIATILSARRIRLLATGESKAEALAAALEGPIGPHNPASFLRLHPDVEIICDAAAASRITQTARLNHG